MLRGGSRISGKGVQMCKGGGSTLLILNIPWKWNNLVSMRPNYFIFMVYLKTGEGFDRTPEPPLDPLLMFWWEIRKKKSITHSYLEGCSLKINSVCILYLMLKSGAFLFYTFIPRWWYTHLFAKICTAPSDFTEKRLEIIILCLLQILGWTDNNVTYRV